MHGAPDTIISTGPSEVAIMGMIHRMIAFVAPKTLHSS